MLNSNNKELYGMYPVMGLRRLTLTVLVIYGEEGGNNMNCRVVDNGVVSLSYGDSTHLFLALPRTMRLLTK